MARITREDDDTSTQCFHGRSDEDANPEEGCDDDDDVHASVSVGFRRDRNGSVSEPRFLAPMLATLSADVVGGAGWVFERKLDGIRLVAVGDHGQVRLHTRNGRDRTRAFPEVAVALRHQGPGRFVVDGEVVAFDGNRTSFERLQQRSGLDDPDEALATGVEIHLYLFDIVHLDGADTSGLPLRTRKEMLREAVDFDGPLRFCAHRNETGPTYFDEACAKGWEGLIAKRADSTYRSGRSRSWLKLKCVGRQELVIGGWTDPKGGRTGLGALLVGYHDHAGFRYAGKVGTGFDDATLTRLERLLDDRSTGKSPFVDPPRGPDLHWAHPELVCEVGFTEWTAAGRLRHPRYLGLRDDKPAAEVRREIPK